MSSWCVCGAVFCIVPCTSSDSQTVLGTATWHSSAKPCFMLPVLLPRHWCKVSALFVIPFWPNFPSKSTADLCPLSLRLPVCLPACLPVCLPAWLPACLPAACLSACLPVCLSACLPVCLSMSKIADALALLSSR